MPNVKLPNGKVVSFPDTMTREEIQSVIETEIMPQLASQPQPTPQPEPQQEGPFDFQVGEMVRNIPSSAVQFGKDIVQPFLHPIETAKGLGELALGAGSKVAGMVDPEGQAALAQQPEWQRRQQIAEQTGEFLGERYGGLENIQRTVQEDLVGSLADLALLATGGGAGVRAAGTAGKLGRVAQTGQAIQRAGQALEPVNIARTALGAPAAAVGTAARKLEIPQTLMEGVLKPSKTLTRADVDRKLTTILDERIPISDRGVKRIYDEIYSATRSVDDIIDEANTAGKTVDTWEIVRKSYDDLAPQYEGFPRDRQAMQNRLLELADEFGDELTVEQAQKLKRNIYKREKKKFERKQTVESPVETVRTETEMAVANKLMRELEDVVPEIRGLNKRASQYLDIKKEVERAVARMGSTNIFSLTDYLAPAAAGSMGGKALAIPVAFAKAIFMGPKVKQKVATALHHMGTKGVRTQPYTQAAFQAGRLQEEIFDE
jgi:hypothetical protein